MKVNVTGIVILIFLIGTLVGGLGSRELFPKFVIKEKIVRPDYVIRDTVELYKYDTLRIVEKAIVKDTVTNIVLEKDTIFRDVVATASKTYNHGDYDISYSYYDQAFDLQITRLDTNLLFREIQFSETPEEKRKKWYERTLIFLGGIGAGVITVLVAK